MYARACLRAVASRGDALNAVSASTPRERAWSISPCTHDSGPRSNSGAVSVTMGLSEPDHSWSPEARSAPRVSRRLSPLYLEPGDRAAQFRRELGELADRHVGLLGALGRLLGDLENALHASRHIGNRCRLPLRLRGNTADQIGELARHAPDFVQRLPRRVRELGSFHDTDRALLHGRHRVLRI